MRSFEVVGTGARPPWWRTALLVVFTGFWSLVGAAISPASWAMQHGAGGVSSLVAMLAMVCSVTLPFILLWRHRHPFAVVLVVAGASVVLPLGTMLPLVALACLLGRRKGPATWWTVGLLAATTAWATTLDARARPIGASTVQQMLAPQPIDVTATYEVTWLEVAILVAVGLGLAVGSGLVVRSRREASSATAAARMERETSDRLGDEVARRQERERIAREVHDSLGHRLSLLNLHAGAMEANATDPRVAKSAQLVRESAAAAMDDLRSLLDLLRQPGEELPPVALSELAKVVRDHYGAGQLVSSSIFIQDADAADPALTRAVYRIVQELLTNARKHAPEEKVFLSVEGRPGTGVTIDVRNRFRPRPIDPTRGTTRGLTGITERAQLLGGTMMYGIDGDDFRVHVELPWRAA